MNSDLILHEVYQASPQFTELILLIHTVLTEVLAPSGDSCHLFRLICVKFGIIDLGENMGSDVILKVCPSRIFFVSKSKK